MARLKVLSYIDHVSIAVHDLESAVGQLRDRLSLIVSRPRVDAQSGISNAVIPLTRGYVELVSPGALTAESPEVARRLHTFLSSGEGIFSFAMNSRDVAGDVAILRERGSTLTEPMKQDVDGEPWWSAFPADDSLEPYVVQHEGAAAVSMSMTGGRQPLSIRCIEEVTLVVQQVEPCVAAYDRDLGISVTRRLGRQVQLRAGTSRIMVVPSTSAPLGTPIGIHSVSLGTTDIKGAQADLRARSINFSEPKLSWGIAVQIDSEQTFGARLNLVQL